MPYFLANENLNLQREIELSGEEARHILLSHRTKVGDVIKLQGPDGKRFLSKIISIKKSGLVAKPEEEIKTPNEPKVAITLFQSIVSEKALDFIFQKGTELGLSKIVLFNSANTATKLSADGFKKKQDRWNKILIEAAKQSERAKWPGLEFVSDVEQALLLLKNQDQIFLADIGGTKISTLSPPPLALGLIIGPEGGFTPSEISAFKSLPTLQTISLGPILLRAETAAIASLAIINNCLN